MQSAVSASVYDVLVWSGRGRVLAEMDGTSSGVICADVRMDAVLEARRNVPAWNQMFPFTPDQSDT